MRGRLVRATPSPTSCPYHSMSPGCRSSPARPAAPTTSRTSPALRRIRPNVLGGRPCDLTGGADALRARLGAGDGVAEVALDPRQGDVPYPVHADLLSPHPGQLPADAGPQVVIAAAGDRLAMCVAQQLPAWGQPPAHRCASPWGASPPRPGAGSTTTTMGSRGVWHARSPRVPNGLSSGRWSVSSVLPPAGSATDCYRSSARTSTLPCCWPAATTSGAGAAPISGVTTSPPSLTTSWNALTTWWSPVYRRSRCSRRCRPPSVAT